MYLRNKKTGETVKFSGFGVTVVGEDGRTRNEIFGSLAELNAEWCDYEEPKEWWYIDTYICDRNCQTEGVVEARDNFNKEIGNYFKTKEEADKAMDKLKAWKRLKDNGFRFLDYTALGLGEIKFEHNVLDEIEDVEQLEKDLDLLFGGEQ